MDWNITPSPWLLVVEKEQQLVDVPIELTVSNKVELVRRTNMRERWLRIGRGLATSLRKRKGTKKEKSACQGNKL